MYGYIYETTNKINGKKYIGKHKCDKFDSNYLGSGIRFKRAVNKYGKENFEVKIIEKINTNQEELDLREMYWIGYFNAVKSKEYYNISAGGKEEGWAGFHKALKKDPTLHPRYGKKLPEEIRKKISEAHKGIKLSDEHKKRLSESHKGKPTWIKGKHHKEETKKKLSKINKGKKLPEEVIKKLKELAVSKRGKNNPMYGKDPWNKGKKNVYSQETLKKMSESAKKRGVSEEQIKRLLASNKNRKVSDETRKKLSELRKGKNHPMYGKHHSESSKKKMSETKKGRKMTQENKKKISNSLKGQNKNKKWINNGKNKKFVKEEELSEYLNNGWKLGMK